MVFCLSERSQDICDVGGHENTRVTWFVQNIIQTSVGVNTKNLNKQILLTVLIRILALLSFPTHAEAENELHAIPQQQQQNCKPQSRLIPLPLCHTISTLYPCSFKHHLSFMGPAEDSAYWFLARRSPAPLLFHTFSGKPKLRKRNPSRDNPPASGHPST